MVKRLWSGLWSTGILVPIAYLLFLIGRAPQLDPHDWDYDEGINLIKALLVERGYHMFSEIWSDQPPLLTVTLAGLFRVTGPDVAAARLLVMVLSALLLWAFYLAVRASLLASYGRGMRFDGKQTVDNDGTSSAEPHTRPVAQATIIALIACGLLVLSEFYLRLSGAVMVGLPSAALAMLSIAALMAGAAAVPGWPRLALSALLMALALQTKLLAAIIAPGTAAAVFYAGLYVEAAQWWPEDWRKRLIAVIQWGVLLVIFYLAAGFALGALHFDLLFGTHFGTLTRSLEDFIQGSTLFFPHLIEQHVAFLLLGALGLIYAVRRRAVEVLIPLLWIVAGVAAFSVHRPLWYHHTIILTVPLTWLCAYGVAGLWAAFTRAWVLRRQPGNNAKAALTAILAAGAIALIVLVFWFYPNPYPERLAWQMTTFRPLYVESAVERLRADAGQTDRQDWIFTDHPFYAFQAGLAVPPEIAVLSRKSLETGIITQEMLAQVLRDYKPHFVLFERFTDSYSPEVMDEIHAHYIKELEADAARYYLRND